MAIYEDISADSFSSIKDFAEFSFGLSPEQIQQKLAQQDALKEFDGSAEAIEEDTLEESEENRFQQQCYLMNYLKFFSDLGKNKKFDYITRIPYNGSNLIHKLKDKDESVLNWFSIKPSELAFLVPKIRLYKMIKTNLISNMDEIQKDKAVIPKFSEDYFEIEYYFDEFFRNEDIESITKTREGRGMGVGIKSFDWELLGTNPAEVNNNIKAKLVLKLNTIADLNRKQSNGLCAKDLIWRFSRSDKNIELKPDYFRLKAVVGWAVPKSKSAFLSNNLISAIEKTKLTLYLYLVNHDITFKENGTIELTIEYRAMVDAILGSESADLFALTESFGTNRTLPAYFAEAKAKNNGATDFGIKAAIAANYLFDTDKEYSSVVLQLSKTKRSYDSYISVLEILLDDPKVTKELKRIYETAINLIKKDKEMAKNKFKLALHKTIFSRLFEKQVVYYHDVAPETIGVFEKGQIKLKDMEKSIYEKNTSCEGIEDNKFVSILKGFYDKAKLSPGNIGLSEKQKDNVNEAMKNLSKDEEITEEVLDEWKIQNQSNEQLPDGNIRIYYVYYGDLIDTVILMVKAIENDFDKTFEGVQTMLGTFKYENPCVEGEILEVNLADLPISLDSFSTWFIDTIIKTNLKSFTIKDFIESSISKIVEKSLSSVCYGDAKNTNSSIGINLISIEDAKDTLKKEDINNVFYKNAHSALVISSVIVNVDQLNTEEKDDLEKGIYHIKIGLDRGLLKSVNFNKVDQPYLSEAYMEKEGQIGEGQLRRKYNADLTMIGNVHFVPGQIIYIDPTVIGMGKKEASFLGLGGYYKITNVKSYIEGTFKTDLKCVWISEGNIYGPNVNSDKKEVLISEGNK
ncbi:hypothetical protein M0R19_04135 [Candidatus Pacearchaeota archaeon]|jgi:hypothetical protein|nr:hypothetical protein [Candidatus Pacearchaeota archaeon]